MLFVLSTVVSKDRYPVLVIAVTLFSRRHAAKANQQQKSPSAGTPRPPSPLAPGLHCATTPSVPFTRIFGHDRATGSAAAGELLDSLGGIPRCAGRRPPRSAGTRAGASSQRTPGRSPGPKSAHASHVGPSGAAEAPPPSPSTSPPPPPTPS